MGICFVISHISSSLQTIYHLPALQPDVEGISKLLHLRSSPILTFFWDEMQNKKPSRSPFFLVWGWGRQVSVLAPVESKQLCNSALESLAPASSPQFCKRNNWFSWGKFFLQEPVLLSLPDRLLLVFWMCYNKTFTFLTFLGLATKEVWR